MTEDEVNRKLLDSFYEYFKTNQIWMSRQTLISGVKARKLLREIQNWAQIRREQIRKIKHEKPKIKSPNYKKSLLKADEGENA